MHTATLALWGAWLGCQPDPCADLPVGPVGAIPPTPDVFADYDPRACVPDELAYQAVAAPILESGCNGCHGDPPAFGAPLSFTDYAALLEGPVGDRPVDRIAVRAANRTMPPPASEPLPHEDLDSLVSWATCGQVHPDPNLGVEVNAPIYAAEVPGHLELPSFDLAMQGYVMERSTRDDYQCFALDAPVEEDRFVQRMQVVVDDTRILHHVVLLQDPLRLTEGKGQFECFDLPAATTPYLYAWAPGTNAFDFEGGGLRLTPGERLIVQVHYNNGAGLDRVVDRSGIRIFHGPVQGTEWFMQDLGPEGYLVPPGASVACETAEVAAPMRFLAGMPHMHQLGSEMHQVVERADGAFESVFDLVGWNFESQRFYGYDVRLEPGDLLHTWCVYENDTGKRAHWGERTQDEMCYHFAYVSEPETSLTRP